MPKRIQMKRMKGWKKPEGAVLVYRPTPWGNPFMATEWTSPVPLAPGVGLWACTAVHSLAVVQRVRTREEAVELAVAMHREMMSLTGQAWHDFLWKWSIPEQQVTLDLSPLRGKDLVCWCPLTWRDGTPHPCHADTLLELANR